MAIQKLLFLEETPLPLLSFKEKDGTLKRFDFVVANPPFSVKNWTSGINPMDDEFNRFRGYGIPPDKNGDYAFLLHIISSLKSTGKGSRYSYRMVYSLEEMQKQRFVKTYWSVNG